MPFSQVKSFTYFCVNVTSVIPGSQNTDILRLYLPHHSVLIIAQSMTKLLIARWNRMFFVDFKSGQQLRNAWTSYILYMAAQGSQGDLETITRNGPLRENTGKERDQQDQWFIFAVTSWAWKHEVSCVLSLLPDLGRKSPESSARAGAGTGNMKSVGQQVLQAVRKPQCGDATGGGEGRELTTSTNKRELTTDVCRRRAQAASETPSRKEGQHPLATTQEEYPEQLTILV